MKVVFYRVVRKEPIEGIIKDDSFPATCFYYELTERGIDDPSAHLVARIVGMGKTPDELEDGGETFIVQTFCRSFPDIRDDGWNDAIHEYELTVARKTDAQGTSQGS
jgi:hypothetical protein